MSNLLQTIDQETQDAIAEQMASGYCTTIEDLQNEFALSLRDAVKLLNDATFLSTVAEYTKAKSNMFFHTVAVPKLMSIAQSQDNKSSIAAIKLVGEYSNNLKKADKSVTVHLSLEERVRAAELQEKNVTGLLPQPMELKQLPSHLSTPEESFDEREIEMIPLTEKGEDFKSVWEMDE